MKLTIKLLIAASLASYTALTLTAQTPAGLERYVSPGNAAPERLTSLTFLPDGENYAELSSDGTKIERRSIKTGEVVDVLVDVTHTRETTINSIEDFVVSPEGSRVLLLTDREQIYRHSFSGVWYVYEVRSRILRPLSVNHPRQQSPIFSPDGRMVAFVADNNIHIKKVDYDTEVAVTSDGAPTKIINGVPDWTYEEEFATTCSMAWAPDNTSLCFIRYDETDVPTYTLPIYGSGCDAREEYALYPGQITYKYPVAGQKNSTVTLHSYDIETRKTKALPLSDSRIEYIPRIAFAKDPAALIVTTLNREQTRMEVYSVNPRTTIAKSILVEENKTAWLDPMTYEEMTLMPESMVIHSSRTGYNHLYEYSYSGALLNTITTGPYDVTAFYGYDPKKQCYYYQSTATGSINRVVSRIDRKGKITDLSPASGISTASFSPDMNYYVLSGSSATQAPSATLMAANDKKLRDLTDNSSYAAAYSSDPTREFFTIPIGPVELNAMLVKPSDFNPSRKYPLIINQYSGPGSQEVLNRWNPDWTIFYAQQGYVVLTVDPRGTGGRGRAFMDVVYRNLGITETADIIAAVRSFTASASYIDTNRIAIYGWSFGGYEALMCATESGTPFKVAVAVAPVTDWRLYDTTYTERYMLTPQQNALGYKMSAPLNRASNLHSQLLLMWGTMDDNVHPANSLDLLSRLEAEGRWADVLVFPNQNHLIRDCSLRATVYARMLHYLNRNL